jgi:hypothetical protein
VECGKLSGFQHPRTTVLAKLLALLFLVFVHSAPLCATTVDPPDFATLVAESEIIFRGKVTAVHCEWVGEGADRHIGSYVSFEVLKTLKGKTSSPYVLEMVGGTVGDQTLEIVGAPTFKVGDRSLLFVQKNGTQFIPLMGIMHGHFRVERDPASGEEILIKHDGTPLEGPEEIDEMHARGPIERHDAPAVSPAPAAGGKPARKPIKRQDFEDHITRKAAEKP